MAPDAHLAGVVADAIEDAMRERGKETDRRCIAAWTLTDEDKRGSLRVSVDEPPMPERGAPQDLAAIVTSPIPTVFCQWPWPPR